MPLLQVLRVGGIYELPEQVQHWFHVHGRWSHRCWAATRSTSIFTPTPSVHKISKNVPLDIAALYNPLTCGVSWAAEAPNTQLGDTMLVMGCGQRGLACVAAAKAAGASMVIITGRGDDHYKLSAALRLGADHVINIDEEDVIDRVRELTGDEGVDTVIDVVPYATQTFVEAIEVVRTGGTVILAGLKGDKTVRILHDGPDPAEGGHDQGGPR